MTIATRRRSKYADSIRHILSELGHATNAQVAAMLRRSYPHVSDTTVHRITQRLLIDGEVQHAPNASDGSMLFDSNITRHDHFECSVCGELRDISIPESGRDTIREAIGDCRVDGSLKIVGKCCGCMSK